MINLPLEKDPVPLYNVPSNKKRQNTKRGETMKIHCNQCGQVIVDDAPQYEDYIKITKSWGYFSNKDLETHEFNLCEKCYDELIKGFTNPITLKKNKEAI